MAQDQMGLSWFLAQLKPNCLGVAQRNLARQGFETFVPLEDETQRRGRTFVTQTRPLFPGYIFVAFDATRGLWRSINSTQGISRLVSFGKAPAAVPSGIVAALQARCDQAGNILPQAMPVPGQRITVTKGPFAGFVAEVEKTAPERRVWVLLEILGGQTRVALSADEVRVA